jgi:hypothetical protein
LTKLADSYDSQDHVSVDSSHDAEEGEDIVDFEALWLVGRRNWHNYWDESRFDEP